MNNFIPRNISAKITEAIKFYSIIVITGPRQTGKTTLCKNLFSDYKYFNLEDLSLRAIAKTDAKLFFEQCGNMAILDEVQNVPELLSYLQVMVDENPEMRIVLTGSRDFALMEKITQSLTGRAALFTLLPIAIGEIREKANSTDSNHLMLNGFYPAVISKGIPANLFYRNYYNTYIERDVRQLLNLKHIDEFSTFMRLCAGRVGSEMNASAIANETAVSSPTIKEWLTVLQSSYIVFKLQPYYANINKRLVKTPKIYFYDTGLLCFLLGIETASQLMTHPLRGAIFENMAVVELLKQRFNDNKDDNLCFYRENRGTEIDIMQIESTGLKLWEVKSAKTFNTSFTRNIVKIKATFGDHISSSCIIYDGESFPPSILNVRDL